MRVSNRPLLQALLYFTGHGCKWRALSARFGPWYTTDTRMNRWSKS
ncbi:MAG: transposase [Terriglobales bacterium]